ncbi:MAG: hypothetical protein A2Y15_07170 [Clostridiales bacterium GWF2_36_10]|nr:MAG: hypothetical protein A2Y15_07170 [Clostridiales bacterium GWF2_36_10]HAN21334.1 hypothetical protein [Clostridiales bacterium]
MKNYLLYFFILLLWTSLIPFTPVVINHIENNEVITETEEMYTVLLPNGETAEMTLDEYVLGVMLTEMPASYEKQALFAQAVCIRSYAVYILEQAKHENNDSPHPDADFCSNPDCCRRYITYDALKALAGDDNATERYNAMKDAVYETSGEILTYNGKTAMTLYHISSPARTESYENVFNIAVPYLTAVNNVDESGFIYYEKEVKITFEELEKLLMSNGYDYSYSEGEQAFATLNENKRSNYVMFGSTEITAARFAELVGLNSNCIEITKNSDGYTICSTGFGSGLGMSQYGANILALQGKTYKEILSFYFTDTQLVKRK